MTKVTPTGFAPSYLTQPIPLEIAMTTSVNTMSPEQFLAYEKVIRETDYTTMLPDQQSAWLAALKAVNKRRANMLAEQGAGALNVTIRDGRPAGLGLPPWGWAIAGVAALMLLLGPK